LEEEQQDIIKKDPYSSLRFAEFRWYLSMRFLFTFGYQMQAVIIGYYIYQLTNSKLALAFAGLAEAFPAIGIALYGGYVADKSEKKRLMLLIFSTMWLCSVVLLLATSPSAHQYISHYLCHDICDWPWPWFLWAYGVLYHGTHHPARIVPKLINLE
jgi:nitrate/nitrite transporter NarK